MNIFVLDENPIIAAQFHCDKHVVKQILETAQMLVTTYKTHTTQDIKFNLKSTHQHHPCTKWVSESTHNFFWLLALGQQLLSEFETRYKHPHTYITLYQELSNIQHEYLSQFIPNTPMTPFAIVMKDNFKISTNPVECYREYYNKEKYKFAKWKNSKIPFWFQPNNKEETINANQ